MNLQGNKSTDHRWNTKEYEKRTRQLYRTELHKLYPSESWALFRILPLAKSVLDLGCGNGAMASITKKISPKTKYFGVDHQKTLIKKARELFPYAKFEYDNLLEFLKKKAQKFECVMSWSVVKSFENWRELINLMIESSKKFVVFDIRVANVDSEIFDEKICWADYGGIKGPIILLNYNSLKKFLISKKKHYSRVEVVAYESKWGDFVHFKKKLNPETFLLTCVIHKTTKTKEKFEFFERLPGNIDK